MRPVYHCQPDEFCCSQRETGGEYGTPLELHCMATHCRYPGKQCLYIKMGGKRPQDGDTELLLAGGIEIMTPDFQPPTFDQYGYPSDEQLDYISRLSPLEHDPFEIAEYINECWHWNDMSRWINRNSQEGCWTISTGGWSGNESIIAALRKSLWWMCYWYREERGGHFWFKIKRLEK